MHQSRPLHVHVKLLSRVPPRETLQQLSANRRACSTRGKRTTPPRRHSDCCRSAKERIKRVLGRTARSVPVVLSRSFRAPHLFTHVYGTLPPPLFTHVYGLAPHLFTHVYCTLPPPLFTHVYGLCSHMCLASQSSLLLWAFVAMTVIGLGNRIFGKLQTIPMHDYPFFSSLLSVFIYVPICFMYIIPAQCMGKISQAEKDIPRYVRERQVETLINRSLAPEQSRSFTHTSLVTKPSRSFTLFPRLVPSPCSSPIYQPSLTLASLAGTSLR